MYLPVAEGMDEMQLVTPPDFPLQAAEGAVGLETLWWACRDWMRVQ
ncbi:MAG: hypothetical protein R2762_06885 [Bryobacteraceae bacterium]